jgi:pimeloyl-[acyl-carrier protein] methyl ester esterase
VNSYDNVCRYLCDRTGINVFSLEYGLSPEHKFPIAVNQSLFAYDWMVKNADKLEINKSNITVMGDSAGGNFATIISHERQQNMPKSQVLIYPAVDMYTQYPSNIKYNKYMYHLTSAWCDKFMEAYLDDDMKTDREKLKNPKLSPLFYTGTKQPKTLILAATHDILIDGIYEYEKKLVNDGTDVETYYDNEMFHGFVSTIDISPLPNAKRALDHIVEFLKN